MAGTTCLLTGLLFGCLAASGQWRHVAATASGNRVISDLLDSLLKGYNKHLRPGFGGAALVVTTNALVRSMGLISEENMMFAINCYFRQNWRDSRLAFNSTTNVTELRPSIKMLHEIWKPDLYFFNGQDSYLHTITYQNRLFRIKQDGSILYSQRITVKSRCPMNLQKYPLDTQQCPLLLGSYGYSEEEVDLSWQYILDEKNNVKKSVRQYEDITMSQFMLTGIEYFNATETGPEHNHRRALKVIFLMKREIGYYVLQIYLPLYLIVIISWVSFWINREATPARVTLGITMLLTTTTIGITGREGIPKVSYSTALDIFLLMCFSFVFAALVESAGVNYFTKTGPVELSLRPGEENDHRKPLLRATPAHFRHTSFQHALTFGKNGDVLVSISDYQPDGCWRQLQACLRGSAQYRNFKSMTKTHSVSVSRIDSISKFMFPFSFLCLNILYWAGFLYYF